MLELLASQGNEEAWGLLEDKVPLPCVKHQHESAVDHPVFGPGEIVQIFRDPFGWRYTDGLEQALLPEAAAAFDGCDCVDEDECCDALHGPGD